MTRLREQLLGDRSIVLAGGVAGPVRERLLGLAARIESFDCALAPGAEVGEDAAVEWAGRRAPLSALVYEAAEAFGGGGRDGLRAALEHGWVAIRAVAAGAMIPGETGGRVVLIAPGPRGAHAEAARAALENVARTLSVEWARYAITTTTIAPGVDTTDEQVADLVAYLVSIAGGYFSGCRFDLGGWAGQGGGAGGRGGRAGRRRWGTVGRPHTRFLSASHDIATEVDDATYAVHPPSIRRGNRTMTPSIPEPVRAPGGNGDTFRPRGDASREHGDAPPRGQELRQARVARVRMIRRRVIAGALSLFVASWLLITLVLVSGNDPALAARKSTAAASSSSASSGTTSSGSSGGSGTTSSGSSGGSGTTSSGSSVGSGTSSSGSSGSGTTSVTTRQS